MAKDTMVVQEIDGEDVVIAEVEEAVPVRRTAMRIESPPAKKQVTRVAMKNWPSIILEENNDIPPIGQFFGLNGDSYLLRPGVEVAVPPGIIEILDNAIMSSPRMDPNTLATIGWRDRLRYPYRLIKAAA